MLEYIISFVIGASLFFIIGVKTNEAFREDYFKQESVKYIEEGYTKAYTEQLGKDVGVPVARCKLSGGEPIVSGNRVACVKEMKDD